MSNPRKERGLVPQPNWRDKLPKHPTIYDLWEPYEASIRLRSTWIQYARCLKLIVDYFKKETPPENIFREDVAIFVQWLVETRGLKPSSADNVRSTGSSWYRWMQWNDLVPGGFNPFEKRRVQAFS